VRTGALDNLGPIGSAAVMTVAPQVRAATAPGGLVVPISRRREPNNNPNPTGRRDEPVGAMLVTDLTRRRH